MTTTITDSSPQSRALATTPFLSAGGFTYSVQVRELQRPSGHIHVHITSQWAGAKKPKATQNVLALTMSKEELRALCTALQDGLASEPT